MLITEPDKEPVAVIARVKIPTGGPHRRVHRVAVGDLGFLAHGLRRHAGRQAEDLRAVVRAAGDRDVAGLVVVVPGDRALGVDDRGQVVAGVVGARGGEPAGVTGRGLVAVVVVGERLQPAGRW